jgi:tripartite-type tricarboxylate transporter receptor subunit TctC
LPKKSFCHENLEVRVRPIRKVLRLAALLARLAALSSGMAQLAEAQDFPSRPIRVLIAFPPGGPTDFVGRLVADKMSALLGQRVYIENKPGANGTVGADNIAKAEPDGYSLFLTTAGAVTISPHVMASIPYDSLRDFAPVAEVVTNTTVLVVNSKTAIPTAKELVALAKQKPGAITFASTGIGSTTHLAQELLADSAGVKFLHVPYRGAAPALTDLLAGHSRCLWRRSTVEPFRRSAPPPINAMKQFRASQRLPSRAIQIPTRRTGMRFSLRQRLRRR